MASTGVEAQSSTWERLAALTPRSKHIDGAGYGTTRADPMLIAGALCGLTPIQTELVHAKHLLEHRAHESLVIIYAGQIERKYQLNRAQALAVSRAAAHCLVHGKACKACHGTGVTAEQQGCKSCEGIGMKRVSDSERAKAAGVKRMSFIRHLAEIADNAETELHRAESDAERIVRRNMDDGEADWAA